MNIIIVIIIKIVFVIIFRKMYFFVFISNMVNEDLFLIENIEKIRGILNNFINDICFFIKKI